VKGIRAGAGPSAVASPLQGMAERAGWGGAVTLRAAPNRISRFSFRLSAFRFSPTSRNLKKQLSRRSHFVAAMATFGVWLRFSSRTPPTTPRITCFSSSGRASHQSGTGPAISAFRFPLSVLTSTAPFLVPAAWLFSFSVFMRAAR